MPLLCKEGAETKKKKNLLKYCFVCTPKSPFNLAIFFFEFSKQNKNKTKQNKTKQKQNKKKKMLQYYTIFVGNPGVGKSTLLKSFPKAPSFQSGISIGQGLTQVLQLAEIAPGEYIADTPGLYDFFRRKEAAREIEKVLKKDGYYRLVFVITLESGRVRPEDAMMVKLILGAVGVAVPFGIVINKLEKEVKGVLVSNELARKRVVTSILSGVPGRSTHFFHPVGREEGLSGKENAIPSVSTRKELLKWLELIPFMKVGKERVKGINTETYEEVREKAAKEIEELKKDSKRVEERFRVLVEHEKKESKERERLLKEKTERDIQAIKKKSEEERKRFEKDIKDQRARDKAVRESLEREAAEMRKQTTLLQQTTQRGNGGALCVIL